MRYHIKCDIYKNKINFILVKFVTKHLLSDFANQAIK